MRSLLYSFFLLALVTGLATGCESDKRPADLLTEEQMVPILKDMQIAYAGVDNTVRNPASRPLRYEEMNKLVLEKHGMGKEQFFSSYQWYEQHPELMDTIYQQVITQLSIDIVPLQNKQKRRPGGVPEAN
ncbi:MAG: DUF4296 domain-containing protein [Bacteroidota bacterium]